MKNYTVDQFLASNLVITGHVNHVSIDTELTLSHRSGDFRNCYAAYGYVFLTTPDKGVMGFSWIAQHEVGEGRNPESESAIDLLANEKNFFIDISEDCPELERMALVSDNGTPFTDQDDLNDAVGRSRYRGEKPSLLIDYKM